MLNNLLNLGLTTLQERRDRKAGHPLAGYPKLLAALDTAERSGSLHVERRSLGLGGRPN